MNGLIAQVLVSIMMLCTAFDARAQLDVQLLWESQAGFNVGMPTGAVAIPNFRKQRLLDANNDGTDDLVMVTEDEGGGMQGLEVITLGPDGPQVVLREDDILGVLGLVGDPDASWSFYGFARMADKTVGVVATDPGSVADMAAFLLKPGAVEHDQAFELELIWRHSDVSPEQARLITVFDVFRDGNDDLVLALAGNDNEWRIQVWGVR